MSEVVFTPFVKTITAGGVCYVGWAAGFGEVCSMTYTEHDKSRNTPEQLENLEQEIRDNAKLALKDLADERAGRGAYANTETR